MLKSKSYLDRDYASISPRTTTDLRYEAYGEDQPLFGSFTSFPDLEDPEEDGPRHIFLPLFCITCLIFAGTFVVVLVTIKMIHEPAETWTGLGSIESLSDASTTSDSEK